MSVRLGSFGATRVFERDREIAGIAAEAYECLKSVAIAGMAHQVLFQDRHCPGISHGGHPAVTARIDRKSVRGPHSPRLPHADGAAGSKIGPISLLLSGAGHSRVTCASQNER